MELWSCCHFSYVDDYRRVSQNYLLSHALIGCARRAVGRSVDLCQTVQERRLHSDFFRHLAKYAALFPEMRRSLPLAGGEAGMLTIETDDRPECLVARVSGEVDLANVDRFRDAIQPAVNNSRHVILDFRNLKYIDSTGLYVVTGVQQGLRKQNCHLVIVGASPTIGRVIHLFGLDAVMPLVSSVDEAPDLLREKSPRSAADG